jgi:hypothetical protein
MVIGEATDTIGNGAEGTVYASSTFLGFGDITSGQYAGGEVVLERYDETTEGPGPRLAVSLRYVKQGNNLMLLASSSDPASIATLPNFWYPTSSDAIGALSGSRIHNDLLRTLGWSLSTSSLGDILSQLEIPTSISLDGATLNYGREIGPLASGTYVLATTTIENPILGTAWAAKSNTDLNDLIAYDSKATATRQYYYCNPFGCGSSFSANDFYFPQPDGTILAYSYELRVATATYKWETLDLASINWNISLNVTSTDIYVDSIPIYDSSAGEVDAFVGLSVVPDNLVGANDLEVIGTEESNGAPVYDLRDKNHPLYRAFYDYYTGFIGLHGYNAPSAPVSYDSFIKANPLFLWRDPFGRLILFKKTDFLDPGGYCNSC